MRTTAIMNMKGGTAKTVTAINLAAILAHDYALRVLLVDADSQANLTEFVMEGAAAECIPGGLSDLLRGKEGKVLPTKIRNVSIIAGDLDLMDLDVSSAYRGISHPMALRSFLETVEDRFEWCVIDCPPAFSAAASAALIAADEVVIPMKVDAFGIQGMSRLMRQIQNLRRTNPDLEVAGVLPTMTERNPALVEQEAALRGRLAGYQLRMFNNIRRSKLVNESTFSQEPLITSNPRSKTLRDYRIFVKRLIGNYQDDVAEGGEL